MCQVLLCNGCVTVTLASDTHMTRGEPATQPGEGGVTSGVSTLVTGESVDPGSGGVGLVDHGLAFRCFFYLVP